MSRKQTLSLDITQVADHQGDRYEVKLISPGPDCEGCPYLSECQADSLLIAAAAALNALVETTHRALIEVAGDAVIMAGEMLARAEGVEPTGDHADPVEESNRFWADLGLMMTVPRTGEDPTFEDPNDYPH